MPELLIRDTPVRWVREHVEGFWNRVASGAWEPQTYREIERHVTPETTVLDIGANIGAITLYAARKAARVICFEPDPLSRAMLLANIAVNPEVADRICVVGKAVHAGRGPIRFGSQASGGDSMSSTILPNLKTVWTVDTITPDEVVAMLPDRAGKVFVKMDIEGGEYALIPAAGALWSLPDLTLFVSTHQLSLQHFMSRGRIRLLTRRLFAALRDYDVSQVDTQGTRQRAALSLLHRFGLAAPLTGADWLFARNRR